MQIFLAQQMLHLEVVSNNKKLDPSGERDTFIYSAIFYSYQFLVKKHGHNPAVLIV